MRTRTRILLALLAIAILGGVIWQMLKPREPVYKGKRLSEWLAQSETATPDWDGANEAVRHIGTNAIPTLLLMMEKRDRPLALKLLAWLQKQRLIKISNNRGLYSASFFHYEMAEATHGDASFGFAILGTNASNAVPGLIRIYKINLSEISHYYLTASLGEIGPQAKNAVPLLMEAVVAKSTDLTRSRAIYTLGKIHAEPGKVVPLLRATLTDTNNDYNIRRSAVDVLEQYGPEARPAVPDLITALHQAELDDKTIPIPRWQGDSIDFKAAIKQTLRTIDPETAAKVLGDENEQTNRTTNR